MDWGWDERGSNPGLYSGIERKASLGNKSASTSNPVSTAYTYTALRYVHDITTGEFVNVGVAIYAPEARYASAICRTTYSRLTKVFPGMNGESFKGLMRFIQSRFEELGDKLKGELPLDGKPSSMLDLAYAI